MNYLSAANPLQWLAGQSKPEIALKTVEELPSFVLPEDDDEAQQSEEEARYSDSDEAPQFPARNSAQRQNNLQQPLTTTEKPKFKPRKKVGLAPGYSALDWAKLKNSGTDLRGGITNMRRITTSELALHKSKDDAWSAYNGRVYNITPYLKFHPGGVPELMRSAGKDGTELFMKTHAWVSAEGMLDACIIGMLVRG